MWRALVHKFLRKEFPPGVKKPLSSEVLSCYLQQCKEPPWTSFFVKYSDVLDNQWGLSSFNWRVGKSNYQVLRTGCYPYIKYHCSKKSSEDLKIQDFFFRFIKISNFGIPCILYGIAAMILIRHVEVVYTPNGPVHIYFLYPETKGATH